MITVSVIIPVRNGGAELRAQLNALTAQEWPEGSEVIVADNGSTDDTCDVAASFEGISRRSPQNCEGSRVTRTRSKSSCSRLSSRLISPWRISAATRRWQITDDRLNLVIGQVAIAVKQSGYCFK